jgi:sarcosine oxidase subunit beta
MAAVPDLDCNVAIIGAGIIGTSVAYHLARRGERDVVVLEREAAPGMGSTAAAAGGIRAQFGSDINIELSRLSIAAFERFNEELGAQVVFHQTGYLWIATKPQEMDLFRANVARQRAHGLDVQILGPAEVARIAPYVRAEDILGGTFHARDGYAPPAEYVQAYYKRSKELGVRYLFGEPVESVDGRVLRTPAGSVRARVVVVAAGAWSGRIGEMMGVEIPVQPVRRQCFVTEPIREGLAHPIPMTVEFTSGVYMHSESGGLLVGMANRDEPPGFRAGVDESFTERIAEAAMRRVPLLERAAIRTAWAGFYEVTPDHHPILGPLPDRPHVFLACGFSGHGVMHAPATGALLAEWITEGRPSLDLSPLRWERFRCGDLIRESHVI